MLDSCNMTIPELHTNCFFCLLWHSNWGWRNASIFVFAMCYWWVYTIKVLALSKQAHRKQIKVPTQLALFLVTFVSISCYLSTYDGVYFGTNGLVWTDIMNRLGAEKAQKFVERSWFQFTSAVSIILLIVLQIPINVQAFRFVWFKIKFTVDCTDVLPILLHISFIKNLQVLFVL